MRDDDQDLKDTMRTQLLEMEKLRQIHESEGSNWIDPAANRFRSGLRDQMLNSSVASTQYIPGNVVSGRGLQAASTHDLLNTVTTLNTAVIDLRERLARMEGFYAWVMHTYPEKFAEFQAMEDFKKVCDKDG